MSVKLLLILNVTSCIFWGCGSPPPPFQSREPKGSSGLPLVRKALQDQSLRVAVRGLPQFKVEANPPFQLTAAERADFKNAVPKITKSTFEDIEKKTKSKLTPEWVKFGDTYYYRAITSDKGREKWIGYTVFGDRFALTGVWLPKPGTHPQAAKIRKALTEVIRSFSKKKAKRS